MAIFSKVFHIHIGTHEGKSCRMCSTTRSNPPLHSGSNPMHTYEGFFPDGKLKKPLQIHPVSGHTLQIPYSGSRPPEYGTALGRK